VTLLENLIEREGEYFKKNLMNLLGLLEAEAKWLLDEESQQEPSLEKR